MKRFVLALVLGMYSLSAYSALITRAFTATVDYRSTQFESLVTLGDTISGTFTVDTSATESLSGTDGTRPANNGTRSTYGGALVSVTISLNSFSGEAANGDVSINNDWSTPDDDIWFTNAPADGVHTYDQYVFLGFQLGIHDNDGVMFSDTLLDKDPATMMPFIDQTRVHLSFQGGTNAPAITANNVVVSTIPIPAAVWLFGSALGLLGWMRKTYRK